MSNTQAAREYSETVAAGEAAQAFGEFAYAVKAATEANNRCVSGNRCLECTRRVLENKTPIH